MIRRADLEQVTRQALVMNLGDLGAQGRAIVDEARREAERIVREAGAERERLLATAHREGFEAGRAEGLAKGLDEGGRKGLGEARKAHSEAIGKVCGAWAAALDAFEGERDGLLESARTEVVRLAAEIAARVTRRAVELDPGVVLAQMEAVLGAVVRPTRLQIRVHPSDLELARDELPSVLRRFEQCRHADLVVDASLEPGSCVATTEDGGRIDAGIASQLDRLIGDLLPGGQGIRLGRSVHGDAA